jgi:hypothetical protein
MRCCKTAQDGGHPKLALKACIRRNHKIVLPIRKLFVEIQPRYGITIYEFAVYRYQETIMKESRIDTYPSLPEEATCTDLSQDDRPLMNM